MPEAKSESVPATLEAFVKAHQEGEMEGYSLGLDNDCSALFDPDGEHVATYHGDLRSATSLLDALGIEWDWV